ncbi:MAG: hypothetical protein AAGF11_55080 [Myxococcota bacterium]
MPSKLVTRREKSARAVIAAARTHGPLAAGAITNIIEPLLGKKEEPPSVSMMLELCARVLEGAIDAVVDADDIHEAELADDTEPRRRRDQISSNLRASIVELKEIVIGLLGRSALKPLRLTGDTPRDPVVLLRYAQNVIEALLTADLPPPRVRGASFYAED